MSTVFSLANGILARLGLQIRSRAAARRWSRPQSAVPACVERLEARTLLSAGTLSSAVSGQWLALLRPGVDPLAFADELRSQGRDVLHVYSQAVSAIAFRGEAIQGDPRLAALEPDLQFQTTAQFLPTGIDRIEADWNALAAIDGLDQRINVDIAILDTGIDQDHPDLNVFAGRNFTSSAASDWDDRHGHGTHVAGTAAALDNGFGVVGVAPGARLWAAKVLGDDGTGYLSEILAGIDWITAHADEIEVANMSLGGIGLSSVLQTAIRNSVAAGVVYVVAAGNSGQDVYGVDGVYGTADDGLLASYPEVMTVSALADSDGQAGGLGFATSYGTDDSFASFSNFSRSVVGSNPVVSPGAAIDLMMPGVGIRSTYKDGGYAEMSGTSMAAPHAAGLVALYIAQYGRDQDGDGDHDTADVYAIRQALINGGISQTSSQGLASLNDRDNHWEPIGWAQFAAERDTHSSPGGDQLGRFDNDIDVIVTSGTTVEADAECAASLSAGGFSIAAFEARRISEIAPQALSHSWQPNATAAVLFGTSQDSQPFDSQWQSLATSDAETSTSPRIYGDDRLEAIAVQLSESDGAWSGWRRTWPLPSGAAGLAERGGFDVLFAGDALAAELLGALEVDRLAALQFEIAPAVS